VRWCVVAFVLVTGCVEELDALPGPEDCAVAAPATVDIGETFRVEVVCAETQPAWFDYDFGDGSDLVRSSAAIREHRYGADRDNHALFRVRVYYPDAAGAIVHAETIIERR